MRTGEEQYLAVKGLAEAGIARISPARFRELARGKAERDTESAPWSPSQVVSLETDGLAPIRTPDDLMRVVTSVLSDIQHDLVHRDASSRKLLLAAKDEDEVQNWIVEQLQLRAKERFHAHREPKVADKKEPDVIIAAIGALIELAIEVKHGGKDWTVRTGGCADPAAGRRLSSHRSAPSWYSSHHSPRRQEVAGPRG
jgi:hypothetical protein